MPWSGKKKSAKPSIYAPNANASASPSASKVVAGSLSAADRSMASTRSGKIDTSQRLVKTAHAKRDKTTTYAIDAMIGQVNGQPIYATSILTPLHEMLVAMANRMPRAQFKAEVRKILAANLKQMLMDALILGEAEKQLTPQQQAGLLGYIKEQRKELIRKLGEGSEILTKTRLRDRDGVTLHQKMEEKRQRTIVQSYLQQKLMPKINVSRKDIERYYLKNEDQFNIKAKRTIHLIRASGRSADKIEALLDQGKPFLEVASNAKLNRYKPKQSGLFAKDMPGDSPFQMKSLNEALVKLQNKQISSRLKIKQASWWICLNHCTVSQSISLAKAQRKIERLLRTQQFQRLTSEYQAGLLSTGSYNSISEMHQLLTSIVMDIYGPAE